MLLKPRPDHLYRRTDTKQLVDQAGDEFDPCDLDVIRALDCGDLVPVKPAKPSADKA